MELNNEKKRELRSFISEELEKIPEGQRIHLDKDLLENLLFEVKKGNWGTVKLPVWSGKFLSKMDLSEISFKDVCLNIAFFEDFLRCRFPDFQIVFSDTNAVINLDEIYKSSLCGCDLSGTKVIGKIGECYFSDLVNCGLTVENFKVGDLACGNNKIVNTNFDNNNLNGLNITMDLLLTESERKIITDPMPSSFKNTGAFLTRETFSEFFTYMEINKEEYGDEDLVKAKSCVDGCYVDGIFLDFKKKEF